VQLLVVHKFGARAAGDGDIETLTLFLFFDHPHETRPSWAIIDGIEVLRLRFLPAAARSPQRFSPYRNVLDCGSSGVVQAVRHSDFQRVERLMRQGVDPNTRSARNNVTLLMCAVGGLDVYGNAVWALLEAGAEVNAQTKRGESALLWAVSTGERGITTPSRLNAVDQLLSRGADVDAADEEGETALLGAVSMGHAEIVATLLSAGADPAKANKAGETPARRAQRLGMTDIAGLIALYLE
jgi:ankyrin repeat protein